MYLEANFVSWITHNLFSFQLNCIVVPTKALADPAELDKALAASLTSGMVASAAAAARSFAQVNFLQ